MSPNYWDTAKYLLSKSLKKCKDYNYIFAYRIVVMIFYSKVIEKF